MHKLLLSGIATVALWSAGATNATTVVFNFDDLVPLVEVPSSYGGAGWSGFTAAPASGATSPPNIAYNTGTTAILDFAPGFTSLTFSAGVFSPGSFSVYGGFGGSGTLLGSLTIDNPPADPSAFLLTGVSFSGIGKSVTVTGDAGQIGWDDVTLDVAADGNVVTEPGSMALVISTFAMIGLGLRRRTKVFPA